MALSWAQAKQLLSHNRHLRSRPQGVPFLASPGNYEFNLEGTAERSVQEEISYDRQY